eukprot:CAMPEP_0205819592 /NCGR_PEP_ID=MMETSP0206-20130828/2035_1 /ASSEMBLY_ACC=CAM_ASM_000279 /TAXON_ID=36767 /ORGANISM="Euplotes focardii, Strain TN1" /LENGTH=222 /DNA_ID=CAMNT_0053113377 /DNA_START=22 /DNA_END=690 /DNA_ORIENTATION=-
MSIKYWGDAASQPCRTIEYILRKHSIEYENNLVVLFKGTRTEDYKKVNPKQFVPTVEHDGVKIFESNSQCRYLLDTFECNEDLLPRSDLKARAQVDSHLDWNGNTVRPALSGGLKVIVLKPTFFGAPQPTEEEKKEAMDGIFAIIDEIEARTGENDFLINDKMSIADVQVYNEVTLANTLLQFGFDKYPNTEKWVERMVADPIIKELDAEMGARLAALTADK